MLSPADVGRHEAVYTQSSCPISSASKVADHTSPARARSLCALLDSRVESAYVLVSSLAVAAGSCSPAWMRQSRMYLSWEALARIRSEEAGHEGSSGVNERERIQFSCPERVACRVNGAAGEHAMYTAMEDADPATARMSAGSETPADGSAAIASASG